MSTLRPAFKEQVTPEILERTQRDRADLKAFLRTYEHGVMQHIPYIGGWVEKSRKATLMEKAWKILPSGDPVIDMKMMQSFAVRKYEWDFHWKTGIFWSGLTFVMSGWQRTSFAARVGVSMVPLAVAMYRGFRRGTDHVNYVGDTFMELHLRRQALVKYLRDYDDYLPEFKEHLVKSGLMNLYLTMYNLHNMPKVEG